MKEPAVLCSQCSTQAIANVNGHPVCVHCFHKLQVAQTLQFRLHAILANQAAAELDAVAPYGAPTPRIQVPEIPKGPPILNNIHFSHSTVGSINTGTVQSIDVNITQLKDAGSDAISQALSDLAQAVLSSEAVGQAQRDQLLDQIAFLSEQAVIAPKDRRPGLIRSTLSTLGAAAPTISALTDVWAAVGPAILSHFGV